MANEAKPTGEQPCPDCGEMVRPNSVRCWNCGGFMRKDMAVKFQQMQLNPKPLTYLEISEKDMGSLPLAGDDDDDFELSVPMSQSLTYAIPPVSPGGSSGQVRIEPPQDTSDIPSLSLSPLSPLGAFGASDDSPSLPSLTPAGAAPPQSERPKSEDDALFDMVTQDVSESEQRKKKRRPNSLSGGVRTATGGFVIYCPYGCRFEVKDSHRGMQGRCPRCRAPFIVPIDPPDYSVAKKPGEAGATGVAASGPQDAAGAFSGWLKDLHLHTVSPDKLKLKADSLLKEFVEYDVGFADDQMLIVNIAPKKAGGLFGGGGDKKKSEAREAMLQHLKDGKPIAELPGTDRQVFSADQVRHIRIVQPVTNRAESLFAGIAVFGTGRISVHLPYTDDPNALPQYLSFSLSEFRIFAQTMQARYGLAGFGAACGAPLEDSFDEFPCHITKGPIRVLRNLDYYKADPTFKLAPVGYQCSACKVTLSEEGRARDSLGGKDGKALAKAKCPKCQQKFGDAPLLAFAPATTPDPAAKP